MSGSSKWTDAAVKDLTFAILMSNNNGGINVNANWDKVTETMKAWGYNFTKGAMSQHWTKRVLKEFRERHPDAQNGGSGTSEIPGAKASTPRNKSKAQPRTPKTSGRGKKRNAAEDDDESSPETNIPNPIARNKTPRATAKKIKYDTEEDGDKEEDEDMEAEVEDVQTKVEAQDDDFGV